MSNVVQILSNGQEHHLGIKEYRRQRVITFRDVDMLHGRPDGTAGRNFRENRERFIEREDFFNLNQPDEIRRLGLERPQGGTAEKIILLTESGYLMLIKSFNDDIAWQVQRQLVNSYFRAKGKREASPDTILLRKLKVANSIAKGLPKPKQIELRRLAVMEAAEESGADYSAVLAVLAAPEPREEELPFDLDQAVDLFLREVEMGGNYIVGSKHIHLAPNEDLRICQKLKIPRGLILKRLEERGLINASYDYNGICRKKHYTAKSAYYDRRRCVQLALNSFDVTS